MAQNTDEIGSPSDIAIGICVGILLLTVIILFIRKPPINYYTRIATIELIIALVLRLSLAYLFVAIRPGNKY